MITLKDIAELTNVSISTVSRVLSNKGNISEDTRERVLSAVNELVRESGSVLMRYNNTSYRIGILIPSSDEYFHDDPTTSVDIRKLIDELEKIGNKTELRKYQSDGGNGSGTIDSYCKDLDGLILFDPSINFSLAEELTRRQYPFLVTNGHFRNLEHNYVDFNNIRGARTVVEYLVSLGHRRICMLAGPERHLVCENRMFGAVSALKSAGITPERDLSSFGAFNADSGYEQCREMIRRKVSFTAIFAFSDFIALGAIKAVKEAGLKVPEDISVIGFDDMEFAKYTEPPLTTVHRFERSISYLIARTITDIILYRKTIETVEIGLRTFLMERESCRALST